jgi:hypothetical protein
MLSWFVSEDERCPYCGEPICPSQDYVVTFTPQTMPEWWHGDCRVAYLIQDEGSARELTSQGDV